MTSQRRSKSLLRSVILSAAIFGSLATSAAAGSWCGNPVTPCDPNNPLSPCYVPPPPDPRCEHCDICTKSPCYTGTGVYTQSSTDLSLPAVGSTLIASRRYESSHTIDGPTGHGWTSSLAAHLYYTTYLFASPSTYQKEADITMPNGARYRFVDTGSGFTPPLGRYDALIHNADGSFDMILQRSTARLHFGPDGTLQTAADEYGNAQTWSYDGNGRILQVADSSGSGRFLNVSWGADGRISGVTDSAGRQVSYLYDARGVMTNFYDALNRVTSYGYVAGRYTWMLNIVLDNWNRVVTQVTYDQEDRTKSYTEDGETYTYAYAYTGNTSLTGKADSSGATWIYSYGPGGLITVSTPPSASNTAPTSDVLNADGSTAQHTDAVGVVTLYSHDAQGNLTSETDDYLGPSTVRFDYAYDPNFPGKVVSITPIKPSTGQVDPTWQASRFDYWPPGSAAPGALYHSYRVRSDGTTLDTLHTYTYDSQGRMLSDSTAGGARTDSAYDSQGNQATVTAPANNDGGTRPVTQFGYDPAGRVTSVTDPLGNVTSYTYDNVDRVVAVTRPRPSAGSALDFTTTSSYDNFDPMTNLVSRVTTDPNGNATKIATDAYGREVRMTDQLAGVTQRVYQNGLLTFLIDANGNSMKYAYDALRRLKTTTFPDGTIETRSWYADGLLEQVIDRKGQGTVYLYDHLKRLQGLSYSDGTGIAYTFIGQELTEVSDATTSPAESTSFGYDSAYRVITEVQGGRGTLAYTYDADDHRLSYTLAAGSAAASYSYYPDGSLDTVTWAPVSGQFKLTYDLDGNHQAILFPNGQERNYTLDNQGRVLTLANLHPTAGNLATFSYGYDLNDTTGQANLLGLRTSMTADVPAAALAGAVSMYNYDVKYALTQALYPAAPPFNGAHASWTYDPLGNRTASLTNGVTRTYAYFTNSGPPFNSQRLQSDGQNTYAYDANGNTSTATGPQPITATWNHGNRLLTLATPASAAYAYDYRDRRSSRTAAGATTSFLYVDLDAVAELSAGGEADYLYGPGMDEPLAMSRAGNVYYFDVDAQGSVIALNDTAGNVVNKYLYDAWGVPLTFTEGVANSYYYTARGMEPGGIQYYRMRYYDPAIGRFLSEDPIGFLGGNSLYSYVLGDPISSVDPFGLDPGAHTCCDGNGGITICWDSMPPNETFRDCITKHEQDHINWFNSHPPECDQCKGKARTLSAGVPTQAEQIDTECHAYQVEIDCLKKHLSDNDKGRYEARISSLVKAAWKQFKCRLG
jgi:RHS repeat-associated protein